MGNIKDLLAALQRGELTADAVEQQIRARQSANLGHTVLDLDRENRTGAAEVIFGEGKTAQQIDDIMARMEAARSNILITRLSPEKYGELTSCPASHEYHAAAQLLCAHAQPPIQAATQIAVVSAGTSDFAVAEEAALTAKFYGNPVIRISDVGVAGLHRLLARIDEIREARVVIAVAGMEGALASVLGGLVSAPVVAVPTSVGYGANLGGITTLLAMLTSCASGIAVVNIDNGFGAGVLAHRINQPVSSGTESVA